MELNSLQRFRVFKHIQHKIKTICDLNQNFIKIKENIYLQFFPRISLGFKHKNKKEKGYPWTLIINRERGFLNKKSENFTKKNRSNGFKSNI